MLLTKILTVFLHVLIDDFDFLFGENEQLSGVLLKPRATRTKTADAMIHGMKKREDHP